MATEQTETSDNLEQVVEEVASQVTEETKEQAEQPAPSYVTQEEMDRQLAAQRESLSRHFQSVTDRRMAGFETEIKAMKYEAGQEQRKRDETYIQGLPEEDKPGAMAKIAYERTNQVAAPETTTPRDAQVVGDLNQESVIQQVQTQARSMAQELGVSFYDMRLWEGTDASLSVQANMEIVRANAQKVKGEAPKSNNTNQSQPTTEPRKPEPVPTRQSPASGTRGKTDEEIKDAIIAAPNDPKVQQAYADMVKGWDNGG